MCPFFTYRTPTNFLSTTGYAFEPLNIETPCKSLQVRQISTLMIGLIDNESKGKQSDALAVEEETDANEQESGSNAAKSTPGRKRTSQILDGFGERTHEGKRQSSSESVDDDQSRCSSSGVRIQQSVLRGDRDSAEAEVEAAKDVDLGEPVDAGRVGLLVAMQDHGGEAHSGGNKHRQDPYFRLVHSLSLLGKVLDEEVGEQTNEGNGQEDVHHGTWGTHSVPWPSYLKEVTHLLE